MHRGMALVVTVVVGGCDPEGKAPVVTVGDSAGVPVHSLSHLPAWDDPEYQWDLTLVRSIPTVPETPGGEPLLYQPQAYARMADGTLVVLDGADLRVAILHPSRNEVIRRFVRSGGGPGEISTWNCAIWPAGPSSFWVLDAGNQRLSRFNVAGTLEGEWPVRFSGNTSVAFQDPVDHAPWLRNSFAVRHGEGWTLVDSIGRLDLEGRQIDYIAPMAPRVAGRRPPVGPIDRLGPLHWFAPIGPAGVVSGRSDSGRFRLYSNEGVLKSVIDVPMERAAVAAGDRLDLEDAVGAVRGGATANWYVGERYGLYDLMWGMDESLFALQQSFVATPSGERRIPDGQKVWRVFSTNGQYEGAVAFPAGTAQPYWIERGRVIATYRDELGVVTIQEYRLARPGEEGRPGP